MEKHIEIIHEGGLKCDAEGCDYTNQIPADQYTDWINRPCPKCGANLLTYEDYQRAIVARQAVDLINSMTKEELEDFSKIAEVSTDLDDVKEMLKSFAPDELVNVSVSTHNEIKIASIKKYEPPIAE